MNLTIQPRWRIAALTLALCTLAACSGKSAPDLLASARKNIDKRDVQTALVEIKNALQLEPASAEAHLLFGKALVLAGSPVEAEVELRKALADGKPVSPELHALLAQSVLDQGKAPKVIEEFGRMVLPDAAADANLKVVVANAMAQTKDMASAEALTTKVLKSNPKAVEARVLQARIVASTGDLPGALVLADALTKDSPDSTAAWMLLANLKMLGKDIPAATAAYRKVVGLDPKDSAAHATLLTLALDAKDLTEAGRVLDAMKAALPSHQQTRFGMAKLAVAKGDFTAARPLLQPLVQNFPNAIQVLQLAGIVEVQLGAFAQGEAMFSKILQLAPEQAAARVLLARSSLLAGYPDRAATAIKPMLDASEPNPEAMTVAAEAQLMLGHVDEAAALYRRAIKAKPDLPVAQTALAMMDVSRGKVVEGLGQLAQVSKASSDTTADLALIAVHQQRRDLQKGLEAIDALEKKDAKSAVPGTLRGQALLAAGRADQAIPALEAALVKHPKFAPAMELLVSAEMQLGHLDKATQRAEEAGKAHPANGRVLVLLARVKEEAGADSAMVAKLVADAVAADPTNAEARAYQVSRFLRDRAYKEAVAAGQEARTALPSSALVAESLGRALLESGDSSQALAVFNKLAQLQPNSPVPYLLMAEAYTQSGNAAGTTNSLRRALTVSPASVDANRALIRQALSAKRPDEAMAVAKDYQKRYPDSATGHLLEGEVQSARLRWPEAITAIRQALGRKDSAPAASRLVWTLTSAGRAEEASQFTEAWLKDHPRDAVFIKNLADVAMSKGDVATAEKRFVQLDALVPNDPAILNNIAWLMLQQKKAGALKFSEQAIKLKPGSANYFDTHANALAAAGQSAPAIEAGKRAIALMPGDLSLQLSIAKVFLDAGDKDAARKAVEAVESAARGNPRLVSEAAKLRAQFKP